MSIDPSQLASLLRYTYF